MNISARELAQVTGGVLSGVTPVTVSGIITDSRSSGAGSGVVFIALRGPNHDGHMFIDLLYARGVRLFLVDTVPSGAATMAGAAFVKVSDTLVALQKLALWHRNGFPGKVIAVTGSAGKTVVKEWLAVVMSTAASVIRSPRSYNSQVGVPLSILNIGDQHEVAIIEAGISRPGEMQRLADMIRPDTVIITNIGDAH